MGDIENPSSNHQPVNTPSFQEPTSWWTQRRQEWVKFILDPKTIIGIVVILGGVLWTVFENRIATYVGGLVVSDANDNRKKFGPAFVKDSPEFFKNKDFSSGFANLVLTTLDDPKASAKFKTEIRTFILSAVVSQDNPSIEESNIRRELRNRIRSMVSREIEKIGLLETVYGRVDTVFSKSVELTGDSLVAKVHFFAEKKSTDKNTN